MIAPWLQPAPVLEVKTNIPVPPEKETHSGDTVDQTKSLLFTQGYCFWRCAALRDETIMVVDQARFDRLPSGAPEGYPLYTLGELEKIEPLPVGTIRLINAAKKAGGAVVISVTKRGIDGKI
jgi:hypothetical protein